MENIKKAIFQLLALSKVHRGSVLSSPSPETAEEKKVKMAKVGMVLGFRGLWGFGWCHIDH